MLCTYTVNVITEIYLTLGIITKAQNELRIQIQSKNINSYRKISLVYCHSLSVAFYWKQRALSE